MVHSPALLTFAASFRVHRLLLIAKKKMSSSDAEIKQFKDFILNYNKLSEMCFMDCVHDFTFREVSKKEESCSENCFDKFVKLNNRISQRFQEIQLSQHDKMQQMPQ